MSHSHSHSPGSLLALISLSRSLPLSNREYVGNSSTCLMCVPFLLNMCFGVCVVLKAGEKQAAIDWQTIETLIILIWSGKSLKTNLVQFNRKDLLERSLRCIAGLPPATQKGFTSDNTQRCFTMQLILTRGMHVLLITPIIETHCMLA